jgi:hypothetical protein
MSGDDLPARREVITLAYDPESNECAVDIGNWDPWLAIEILRRGADRLEDVTVEPIFQFYINGEPFSVEIEED